MTRSKEENVERNPLLCIGNVVRLHEATMEFSIRFIRKFQHGFKSKKTQRNDTKQS